MSRHHVVLIPGFFGFGSLGQLTYFNGVSEALEHAFAGEGLEVNVVEVPTLPTASIRHRAARVYEVLARLAREHAGPIHIVGHSTGGLDARLAIAPTASLPTHDEFHEYDRIRTLVTISTPHFGTPLASFFGSAAGYPLLKVVAAGAIASLRHGHRPLGMGFRVGSWLARADDLLGFRNTLLDQFFEQIIADFSPERRAELIAFIERVAHDRSLVFQLTPAGCDLLNACTADPEYVRYGSVVCRARAPALSNLIGLRHNPYDRTMHALYGALHRVAGSSSKDRFPELVPEQRVVLERAFGQTIGSDWSDGIVPTLSQVWGEVIHAVQADHLDVVGHFGSERGGHSSADWLPTYSGFDERAFTALWGAVARFITDEARRQELPWRHNVGFQRTYVEVADDNNDGLEPKLVTAEQQALAALETVETPP